MDKSLQKELFKAAAEAAVLAAHQRNAKFRAAMVDIQNSRDDDDVKAESLIRLHACYVNGDMFR